ncbi:Oligosaccharyltransferase complex subunit ostc isoform 1 [Schistosoma japonicum]|uniref:Oligosaccharyltransferase complex subunit n=1 Tax=Schistosoma japonicum TaxID=6182 RepID=A0A4Z2DN77_SCHJA|nr:Oligosaccharyltransferase complex subunit ostc isoform 1 [Schistosoma japonicum]TNN17974.1 Oligosaccharyltransferase complex subunit ostc isoform 1 [Schistosoma japonicum]
MIVGPPSMGTEPDARGNQRPVAIMVWRLNSQYILEGLAASFMFVMGSFGFIVMDKVNEARVTKLNHLTCSDLPTSVNKPKATFVLCYGVK